jgi:hypothetical protein
MTGPLPADIKRRLYGRSKGAAQRTIKNPWSSSGVLLSQLNKPKSHPVQHPSNPGVVGPPQPLMQPDQSDQHPIQLAFAVRLGATTDRHPTSTANVSSLLASFTKGFLMKSSSCLTDGLELSRPAAASVTTVGATSNFAPCLLKRPCSLWDWFAGFRRYAHHVLA